MAVSAAAIIPAGGRGKRMGEGIAKQYLLLDGVPILSRTLQKFQQASGIEWVCLAVPETDLEYVREKIVEPYNLGKARLIVAGGSERQDSVRNGFNAVPEEFGVVVVHDGVRPFITPHLIDSCVNAAALHGAVSLGLPVNETIKLVNGQLVSSTVDRSNLWLTQTPQAFKREILLAAYSRADADKFYGTDEAMLVERLGIPVRMIRGTFQNVKITTPEDLRLAEIFMQKGKGEMRTGFGYDSHRLVAGRKLILGGIEVPSEKGLLGHSDADVLAHSIADAILGALAEGDLGRHFPDTDPAYKDISSFRLLEKIKSLMENRGFRIGNIDVTVVLEKPKLLPHVPEIRKSFSDFFGADPEKVSIKAKSNEGMGSIGRGEGIAAFAVVMLEKV